MYYDLLCPYIMYVTIFLCIFVVDQEVFPIFLSALFIVIVSKPDVLLVKK